MELKDFRIKADTTREMTKERETAITEYLELNKKFKSLRDNGIVTIITIYKLQEEVDIEKILETMKKAEIDNLSEEELKAQPKKDQEYEQFLLLPYAIYEWGNKREQSLDNYDTDVIQLINERIKVKVETYAMFIEEDKK